MNKKLLLIPLVIFVFLLVYSPHFSYPYPLHADEWYHIYRTRSLLVGKYSFSSLASFEIGYHVFLAFLTKIGLDIVMNYKYLAAIFAIFSSIVLFSFIYYLTKSYWASFFSVIFFASLHSNVNLLGLWFAIPLTLAIPLIYLSIFLFIKGFKEMNNKILLFSYLTFFLLLLVHPVSGFFVFFIFSIYLAVNYKEKMKFLELWKTLSLIPLVLLSSVVFFLILTKRNLSWIISTIVFRSGWTPFEPGTNVNPYIFSLFGKILVISPYFLPLLFGFVPFILSFVGLYFSLKKKDLQVFALWFAFSVFMIFLFVNFNISPFIPYQRMLYYFLLVLSPLAGIGLYEVTKLIRRKFVKTKLILIIILLVLVFLATFYDYGKQPKGLEIYHLIDESDYEASKFLEKQEQGKIISDIIIGSALPALTGKDVLAGWVFLGSDKLREEAENFFVSGCENKKEIIDKYNIKYVYSRYKIICENLKQIYFDKVYIYKAE